MSYELYLDGRFWGMLESEHVEQIKEQLRKKYSVKISPLAGSTNMRIDATPKASSV
jgi:hypothetical protein